MSNGSSELKVNIFFSLFFSGAGVTIADDFFAGPSSSYSQRSRMLEFNIQHNNRMIQLKVPDTEDLKTLKMLLQGETGFPPCQQDLRGFKVNVFPMSGEIIKNYALHQQKI